MTNCAKRLESTRGALQIFWACSTKGQGRVRGMYWGGAVCCLVHIFGPDFCVLLLARSIKVMKYKGAGQGRGEGRGMYGRGSALFGTVFWACFFKPAFSAFFLVWSTKVCCDFLGGEGV